MNIVTQLGTRFFAQKNNSISREKRGFYFISGFGIILATVATPPDSMLWMAAINAFGIGLIVLSILGKRLFATRAESGFLLESKQISSILTGVIGVSLAIVAIAMPVTSVLVVFYLHTLSILLVTHALLDADSLLGVKWATKRSTLPTDANKKREHPLPFAQAA
jgi:hypothetical protein